MTPVTKEEMLYQLYIIAFQAVIKSQMILAMPLAYNDFKVELQEMLKRQNLSIDEFYDRMKPIVDFFFNNQDGRN